MAVKEPEEFWLVALHTLPGIRMARVARILEILRHEGRPLSTFFTASPEEWTETYGLPAPVAEHLRAHREQHLARARELWQELQSQGVRVMAMDHPRYPPELRRLPYPVPVLYTVGEETLWSKRPRIAFLNSRFFQKGTDQFLRSAASAVEQELRLCVVTSAFRLVYRMGAEAAVEHGAPVILVGDRGIRFLLESRWLRNLKGTWLLVTPAAPEDVGTPGSGMVRDDLIGCLADVLVGFEIYRGGNMERQFREALKAGKTALVWQRKGHDLANPHLIQQGALSFATEAELVARLRDELGL